MRHGPSTLSRHHLADPPCPDLAPYVCSIGTEHEKLGFNVRDNSRMTYPQIEQMLRRLAERFGWEPLMEEGKIIGVSMDKQTVTLEPGGQFELSGAPLETIHRTCAEVNSHLYQVRASVQPSTLHLAVP